MSNEEEEEETAVKCLICNGIVDTDEIECVEDLSCTRCAKPFPCMTHAATAHPDVDYTSEKDVGAWCCRCDGTFCSECWKRCDKCPPQATDDSWDCCWDCSQKHGCTNKIFFMVQKDHPSMDKDGWPSHKLKKSKIVVYFFHSYCLRYTRRWSVAMDNASCIG